MMYFSRIRLRPGKVSRVAEKLGKGSYGMHQLFWELFTEDSKRNFLFREEIAREQLGVRPDTRGEPVYYVVSATQPDTGHPLFHVDLKTYKPKLEVGDRLHFELRANPVINRNGKKHDVPMDAQRQLLDSLCTKLSLHSQLPDLPKKQDFKSLLLVQGDKALDEKLAALLASDARYADRLEQSLTRSDKLEWAMKSAVDQALEKWLVSKGESHGFVLCKDGYEQLKLQSSGYLWHALSEKAKRGTKSGFSSVDFTGELEVRDVDKFEDALFSGIGRSKAFGCGLLMVRRT